MEEKSATTVFGNVKGKKSEHKTYFHVTNSHGLSLMSLIIWFKIANLYGSMDGLLSYQITTIHII